MNFDLSEEQELFKASAERFVQPIDTEFRRKLRSKDNGYDRARWQELAELGLIAVAAPEEAGGLGGSAIDLAVIAEALGNGIAPDPWLENGVLPVRLLAKGGAADALEGVISGSSIVAFAHAERGQRYNLAASSMKALASGDGYLLSGEKTFVLGGGMADAFIVTAVLDGETAAFLIAGDAEGLDRRDYRIADGGVASELRLNGCNVDSAARLDLNLADLEEIVSDVRLLSAAELLGLGARLFADTLTYVKEREQFGVPIGSFQALQHRLVTCYGALEQARSMVYRAALADRSNVEAWKRSAAGAKAYLADQIDMVAREAVQMHGGMGITDELSIGHAMKRVMLLAKLFGDGETARAEYAEAA
ncbi:acyl-CoA dehydrogenase family protein [Altererythrobacter sp. MF3-039]|uniref:acyl-CoA dehydrogenase family protein n=1 Tax=Altererythrobacter sp. MF3-039 TaxID=3252901 RepID=UPI00390C6366